MAESEVSGQSTTNRRFHYDLKICSHCQKLSSSFLEQVPRHHTIQYVAETDLGIIFQDSLCILYVLCDHNVRFVKNNLSTVEQSDCNRLILCTSNQDIQALENDIVYIPNDENGASEHDFEAVLTKIYGILESYKLYDDTRSPIPVRRHRTDTAGEELVTYAPAFDDYLTPKNDETVDDDHLYEPLVNTRRPSEEKTATGQFVEATSLKPNKNGIQILDDFVLPTEAANITEDVNYIKNIKLENLRKEHKIKDIAEYLNSPYPDVTTHVINTLTDECFQLPLSSIFVLEIQKVLYIIWKFLDKWTGDIIMVKSITLLSNLLLAKAFQLILRHDDDEHKASLLTLLEKGLLLQIHDWLGIKIIDNKAKRYLTGSKYFMEDLVNSVRKRYRGIQLGDWKVSLRHKRNRKNLVKGIRQMSLLDQVSTVLDLICLKCGSTVPIPDLPSLVEKTCNECFTNLKKHKEVAVLYSYCIMVTRSLVYLIQRVKETDDARIFMAVIKQMFLSRGWSREQRETLSQEIWPLLLHGCLEIRLILLAILASYRNIDMGVIVRSYIQNKLQAGRLFIAEEVHCYSSAKEHRHKPHWSDCRGVFGTTDVSLKILVPSQNCVAKGIDDKYKHQVNIDNERFDNTLAILSDINRNGKNKNIATLVSFQQTNMPLFYAIQADGVVNLLQFLLERRGEKQWCCMTKLGGYVLDAILAIRYLHSKNIVHRDITACRFDISPEKSHVRLTDLRLAKKLHRLTDTLCLDDSSTIAVRWSAEESLTKDEFSVASDVWMMSLFVYEVFTHGCWPFSELVDVKTEDIMHKVITRSYNQAQPSCIPDKIFKSMLLCFERRVDKRPALQILQETMTSLLVSIEDENEINTVFPKLLKKQTENNGHPELGVPKLIQQLKDRAAVPYYNTKTRPLTVLPLQHEDLIADDEPEITQDKDKGVITVSEQLRTFAKMHNLPNYHELHGINNLPNTRLQKIVDMGETYLNYTYNNRDGATLIDHAFKTGSTEDLIRKLYRLSKLIQRFHDNGWIVRCFSAKDVWKTGKNKVCLLRLGRACKLEGDTAGDGHVKDDPFPDRLHWLPLEVHRDKCYTKKSDVYMLSMVMYEVFKAVYFNKADPLRNPVLCVPFYDIPRADLQDTLYKGEVPKKPAYCPCSLYKLMIKCWSRDVVNRPTISDILESLKDILRRKDFNAEDDTASDSTFDPDYSSFSESESDSNFEDEPAQNNNVTPPVLPQRNRNSNASVMSGRGRNAAAENSNERITNSVTDPRAFSSTPHFLPQGNRNSNASIMSGRGRNAAVENPNEKITNSITDPCASGSNISFQGRPPCPLPIMQPCSTLYDRRLYSTVDTDRSTETDISGSNDSFPQRPPCPLPRMPPRPANDREIYSEADSLRSSSNDSFPERKPCPLSDSVKPGVLHTAKPSGLPNAKPISLHNVRPGETNSAKPSGHQSAIHYSSHGSKPTGLQRSVKSHHDNSKGLRVQEQTRL